MAQYFSPGVYVEEVDAGPRPIQGVSTSVTGAVGVTVRGPTRGKPELVTSFLEFTQKFGGFLAEPAHPLVKSKWTEEQGEGGYWWRFAHSVKGFFDNGGQQLYVKRVFSKPVVENGVQTKGAMAATATLGQGLISEIEQDAKAGADRLVLRHVIAIKSPAGAQVKVIKGDTRQPIEVQDEPGEIDFTVASYVDGGRTNQVALDKPLAESVSAKRGDYVEIHSATPAESLKVTAKALGAWGNDLFIRIRPMVGATLTLQHSADDDPTPLNTTIHSDVEPPADSADPWVVQLKDDEEVLKDGDTIAVLGGQYILSDRDSTEDKLPKFKVTPRVPESQAQEWKEGTSVRKIRRAGTSGTSKVFGVTGAGRLYEGAIVELDNDVAKEILVVEHVSGNQVTFTGAPAGNYLEGHTVRLIESEVAIRYTADGTVEAEELFENLRLTGDSHPLEIGTFVSARSNLVDLENLAGKVSDMAQWPIARDEQWQRLIEGDDKFGELEVEDFVGEDGGADYRTGVQALEDIDDISLVVVPGVWSPVVRAALIQHCEAMKYRFAILDPPPGLSIEGVRTYRAPIDTRLAALYYPWLRLRDPSTSQNVVAPPSGHIAGLYSRVDAERGVHKAPANEIVRGILPANPATGIGGLHQDITKREQDLLNPQGINAIRFFPGRGQRVWGARTVSSDSNFKYVNVRRIFNFIEASIDRGTQFVVFEPNDSTLWARVRQTIANFLNTQWRAGVLEGRTAAEAYFVACDRGVTMTQDDIENGRLICEVGIAPVYPAEFVIFRIQKYTAESKLSG